MEEREGHVGVDAELVRGAGRRVREVLVVVEVGADALERRRVDLRELEDVRPRLFGVVDQIFGSVCVWISVRIFRRLVGLRDKFCAKQYLLLKTIVIPETPIV